MAVNFQIKGMLARLLATEDLIVEHKKVETASFNVHTRVLTLPMWEKASDIVYTMLVAHECAHAIYTDDIDWTQDHKIPPQFVNVVEDARIEKLMKRRYAGLAKTFYTGYKELADDDFFGLNGDDVNTYNLADRVNLYFKIGNFLSLSFTSTEQEIVDVIANTETFVDALKAAELLYNYCKQEKEQEEINVDLNVNQEGGSGDSFNTDSSDYEQNESDNSENMDKTSVSSDTMGSSQEFPENSQKQEGGSEKNEPEVKTMDSLEKSMKELINDHGAENVYIEIPNVDLNQIIVSNNKIHDRCKKEWQPYFDNGYEGAFKNVDSEYLKFKKSAQKEVNYLVKEFECRKAADSYARASISKTGVLDCSKLHAYRYNEDIFKKITTLADGKNHGLIFILDWSGSMGNVLLDTVKQLFNLIWFCKKVSIPFEVYAFTTDYPVWKDENGNPKERTLSYSKKEGLLHVGEWFSLMNFLTSKVNGKTLEDQMKNIFRVTAYHSGNIVTGYNLPSGLSLSGTPLNESLVALHQILPKFQKENKLQKVQCVILTDGEGHPLKYHKEFDRKWEDGPYIGTVYPNDNAFLRDRKTGNTYSFSGNWIHFTDTLLKNLKDKFTDVNFIGIRVLSSSEASSFMRRYTKGYGSDHDQLLNSWKKEKSFSIKNSGYHVYFGLSSNALAQESEFSVNEDATKSQIKSAFVKSLRTKKMNKKVLGEFIDLVA